MEEYDVVITGGGPAGLFCALWSGRMCRNEGQEKKILLLEKKESCGKKLMLSGLGQCNVTNARDIKDFTDRYGDAGRFVRPSLFGFTNRDLISFFEERGIPLTEENGGKVFPKSKKASDILDLLLLECEKNGVEIRCSESVIFVDTDNDRFITKTENSEYLSGSLVIATGGKSYPGTGSSGDGYRFAETLGHSVTEIAPALCAVYPSEYPFSSLSGISFENISVSLYDGNKKTRQITGDLLLTHKGLSGPCILHMSRYIRAGNILKVSFIKEKSQDEFRKEFTQKISETGTMKIKTVLSGYGLPERFVKLILSLSGIETDMTCAHLSKKARNGLISNLTEYPFLIKRTGSFNEAMATAGGVLLSEINSKTMESKIVPNLYFIGEVLDIDGDTGGYNLQAAFSTAHMAALRICSKNI